MKQKPKTNQPNSASLKHSVWPSFWSSPKASTHHFSVPLTALLGNCHHCVVANQAGYKGQGTGPEVFNDSGHERPGQSLLKRLPSWSVLSFVAMWYDDTGYGLFCKAARQQLNPSSRQSSPEPMIPLQLTYFQPAHFPLVQIGLSELISLL